MHVQNGELSAETFTIETNQQVTDLLGLAEYYLGDTHPLVGHLAITLVLDESARASKLPVNLTEGDARMARALLRAQEVWSDEVAA